MDAEENTTNKKKSIGPVVTIILAGVICFLVAALLMNIFERKQEAKSPFFNVVELNDDIEDPEVWGKNFPLQYDDYKKTVDMVRTRYGGSEAIPREPDEKDPRSVTSASKLESIPQLKRMWAGYAFAKDFRQARGHAYMLEDQLFTGRQSVPQPGTCLQCHASVYSAMKKMGDGDLAKGFEELGKLPYKEAAHHVSHPVSCIDCHDSKTMALRITRPAFAEGIAALKKSQGIDNYDVNTMATRQEMRSFVCGQCHVEYYFAGDLKRLTYPWKNGNKVDDALEYYNSIDFKDWVHAETKTPMLKAQHPEFEMWQEGVHAKAGVSCADCHMPYKRVGASKISDHHVRSPLLNINNACQTCHKHQEEQIRGYVELVQTRNTDLTKKALNSLVDLIDDLKKEVDAGTPDDQLTEIRQLHRKASFFVDWVEAENSAGFHAPQESARILAEAIDASRQGQILIRDLRLKK